MLERLNQEQLPSSGSRKCDSDEPLYNALSTGCSN
jgi:hypothetical protein